MDLLSLSMDQIKIFLLILTRISVVLFMFPVFSSTLIAAPIKAGLALVMAFALFPVVKVDPGLFPESVPALLILGVSEFFIGMVLGLSIRIFLSAVELAGQMIGFQMGFSIINILDPQTGAQVDIIGQIGNLVVLTVFLALNGHHLLISGMIESYRLISVGTLAIQKGLLPQIISQVTDMFVIGVKMGAPAIVALLFTSAGFGIAAKFVPQMNILMAAFPVKIVIGLIFFGLSLQIMAIITVSYLDHLPNLMKTMLLLMHSG
jgi:flagellar biosynthesis protein FliR